MEVKFNHKNHSIFSSALLDKSIKFWSTSLNKSKFSITVHLDGINCIEFFNYDDSSFLASDLDDTTIRIWDYQTKSCLNVLIDHSKNINSILNLNSFPILISLSEDKKKFYMEFNFFFFRNNFKFWQKA
jgi:coatomer subunit beta'